MSEQPHVILLAEDRDDDVVLITKAFKKTGLNYPLFVVSNGEEVISYLEGIGKFSNRAEYPLPELLLLDLKMPGTDGFEVLRWVRAQPGFGNLRILVLTSSVDIQDVNRAYGLGANSFMVKPFDFENTKELARLIKDYWFGKTKSPEVSRPEKKPNEKQD